MADRVVTIRSGEIVGISAMNKSCRQRSWSVMKAIDRKLLRDLLAVAGADPRDRVSGGLWNCEFRIGC